LPWGPHPSVLRAQLFSPRARVPAPYCLKSERQSRYHPAIDGCDVTNPSILLHFVHGRIGALTLAMYPIAIGLAIRNQTLRSGVLEFLYPPVSENLRKALDRAQRLVHRRPPGRIFGVLSAKGGCGATTLACHTAVAIAERSRRQDKSTVLIDLDLNTGMVRF